MQSRSRALAASARVSSAAPPGRERLAGLPRPRAARIRSKPAASAAALNRRHRPARRRKCRRVRGHRSDFAHNPIFQTAGGPTREYVGQHRGVVTGPLRERRGAGRISSTPRSADTPCRSARPPPPARRRRPIPRPSAMPPAATTGTSTGVDDLRNERHGARLRVHRIGQEHAAVAAGFISLRDHRVASARRQPAGFGDRGRRAEYPAAERLHPVEQARLGSPK